MTLSRSYFLTHAPIDFHFSQNARDFVVEEVPLYDFSGEGEHMVIKVRKKGLSTWELLDILSAHTGIKKRDFGYAGLKDKEALTYQYLTFNKKDREKVESFSHDQIKIVETTFHNNKIKRGHLKGNRFFIRLKKVLPMHAEKIVQAIKTIEEQGIPNFFGYQRFGNDGDNHIQGQKILEGSLRIKNINMRSFLLNAYQSHLFNAWLSKRIEFSHMVKNFTPDEVASQYPGITPETVQKLQSQPQFFKLLEGDVISHYPYGRLFFAETLAEEAQRFFEKKTVPTGLLSGKKSKKAEGDAAVFEAPFDTITKMLDGDRRFAWIFPEEFSYEYKEKEAWFEMKFFLPKGCYATNVIQEIARGDIR